MAVSGDTAVVGAYGDGSTGTARASASVFVRSGTTWALQTTLTAPDAAVFPRFGFAVAVDGDTAVVGAPLDDGVGADSGSAYVFVRPSPGNASA